jgi:hypothetical protein
LFGALSNWDSVLGKSMAESPSLASAGMIL